MKAFVFDLLEVMINITTQSLKIPSMEFEKVTVKGAILT